MSERDEDVYKRLNDELGVLHAEVRALRVNQHVFWEVQQIITKNPNLRKPSTFYGWMGNMYAAAMSVAVRRLIDKSRDTVSFVRLLEQLRSNPSCVSREAYKKRFANPSLPRNYIDRDYGGLVGQGMAIPDQNAIAHEINSLKKSAEPLKRFVDENIAHSARRKTNGLPKFKDLDDAIEVLDAMCMRYLHLFRGTGMTTALPTWQYDWKEIFRYAWISDSDGDSPS